MRESRNPKHVEQLCPADKARLCLPGVELTDEQAAALAQDLDWADTMREVAGVKIQRTSLEETGPAVRHLLNRIRGWDRYTRAHLETERVGLSIDRLVEDLEKLAAAADLFAET